jgi:hypothetical protein
VRRFFRRRRSCYHRYVPTAGSVIKGAFIMLYICRDCGHTLAEEIPEEESDLT